ncbi:RRP15-like protein [Corticium candelabrum]|uniref:RRP15-like protein n=1 Tax=Corticium candelabrum TaxID=121492 RepID=UPI002E25C8B8|nr:RRP15-like protein [Corticium candelabrum]
MIHATEDSGSAADVDSDEDTLLNDVSTHERIYRRKMTKSMSRIFPAKTLDKTRNETKAKRAKTLRQASVEDKEDATNHGHNEQANDRTSESENRVEISFRVWDPDRERRLKQTATKGVVKLFNAVNRQQKEMDLKLRESNTEAKRARVVQSVSNQAHFVDMLKHNDVRTVKREKPQQEKTKEEPAWAVLRDDFMMAAKMRDWDK